MKTFKLFKNIKENMSESSLYSGEIFNFFADQILVNSQEFQFSIESQVYVAGMLTKFIDSEKIPFFYDNRPLALIKTDVEDRHSIVASQNLGDYCLFLAGFRNGWVHSRFRNIGYCISFGQDAYGQASVLASENLENLFKELRLTFVQYTTVLRKMFADKDLDLEDFFDLFELRTDPNAVKLMIPYGVMPQQNFEEQ